MAAPHENIVKLLLLHPSIDVNFRCHQLVSFHFPLNACVLCVLCRLMVTWLARMA